MLLMNLSEYITRNFNWKYLNIIAQFYDLFVEHWSS